MKSAQQLEIVCNLTESIKNQFAKALRDGEVPEEWDGFELRRWLADKFTFEARPLDRKRMRAYRNVVATSSRL